MTNETLLLLIGAALGGLVQGIAGFAFGMVAMSLWAWGIEPRVATIMAVFGGLFGQALSAVTVRRRAPLAILLPFLAGGLLGVPLGLLALPLLDPVLFRFVLGAILVVFCPAMLLSDRMPKISGGGGAADAAAGVVGGLVCAVGGVPGVASSLWCTLRGYDKELARATIQNFNLAVLAGTFSVLLATGSVSGDMLPLFPLVALALVVPSLIGARIYTGLSAPAFRRVVLSLLLCSGLAMLAHSAQALLGQ
ncbi:MAG: sulfite exporter TauE/SafE family protein [Rhodocyclales bacterium]|nr:sulfite exporter TauE/SafE family protein [Rhodocyclales bacterium]